MKLRVWATVVALIALLLSAPPAAGTMPGSNGRVAFTRGGDVYTVAGDGSGLRRLTSFGGGASFPAWSPDGTRIAYSRGGYVWRMTSTGADKRRLFRGSRASWSPDGRSMVYSDDSVYPAAIMVRSLAGGAPSAVEVYADSGACPFERRPGPSARWTADGTSIVYGAVEQGGTDDFCGTIGSRTEIRQAAPVGSGVSPPGVSLTSWPVAARSPDVDTAPTGDCYVFTTDAGHADGLPRLYLGNRSTGTRNLLVGGAGTYTPAFSPDGRYVLFTQHAAGRPWLIQRVTLGSSAPPVTIVRNGIQPDWQPGP